MPSDSFANTNGTALTTHDANWSFVTGSNNGEIRNNGVNLNVWSNSVYRYTGSNGNLSKIVRLAGNTDRYIGPSVRVGSSTAGYHFLLGTPVSGNLTELHIYKNTGWQATQSVSVSASSNHILKITAEGTSSPVTVRCFVDGSQLASWQDSSSPYTSGLSGIFMAGGADNSTPLGDDWADFDFTLAQEGYRFRNDDGSESTATWKAAQDTDITLAANTTARLRMIIDAAGDPESKDYQLEYRYKPSGGSFGGWKKVT